MLDRTCEALSSIAAPVCFEVPACKGSVARSTPTMSGCTPAIRPGSYVLISVTDTGTGMTSDVMERAFEPFFTAKPTGSGTGLGLSMVYGFAKQSAGHLQLYSELGEGTTVRLFLPRADAGKDSHPNEQRAEEAPPRGTETILVVEDDARVRRVTVSRLQTLGYFVIEATNGIDALKELEAGHDVALLFSHAGNERRRTGPEGPGALAEGENSPDVGLF